MLTKTVKTRKEGTGVAGPDGTTTTTGTGGTGVAGPDGTTTTTGTGGTGVAGPDGTTTTTGTGGTGVAGPDGTTTTTGTGGTGVAGPDGTTTTTGTGGTGVAGPDGTTTTTGTGGTGVAGPDGTTTTTGTGGTGVAGPDGTTTTTGTGGTGVAGPDGTTTTTGTGGTGVAGPDGTTTTTGTGGTGLSFLSGEDEKKKTLQEEIDQLDSRINIASENGMFGPNQKNVPVDSFNKIQNYLKTARKFLFAGNIADADYDTSLALHEYNNALYSTRKSWRFSNIYAGYIWIYLVAFLVAILAFYWAKVDAEVALFNVKIQNDALYAASWGAVGGILRGLWFLKEKVSERKYSNAYRIYFFSVPFLGGLFGAIMYFALLAGVFIVGGQPPAFDMNAGNSTQAAPDVETGNSTQAAPDVETGNSTQAAPDESDQSDGPITSWAFILFATLAGFNWEWAVAILKRIGDSFKETTEPIKKFDR